ncbi:hypothetical protein PG994_006015 [Apiospora phragmitis]|uniref:C2H2-type domain-containing protein n=1 Tax=Apiospora phragmitis TaxID=2905665 RepID=A0ABR1VDV7_9PEZI
MAQGSAASKHREFASIGTKLTKLLVEEIRPDNKRLGRFYEPLFLLEALNVAASDTAIAGIPEDYTSYVYKLAHVCDNSKGGSTVTSFMVLRGDDGADSIHYWFAVNQRSEYELDETKTYVERLLKKVAQLSTASQRQSTSQRQSPTQKQSPHDALLRDVLQFNTPRLAFYLKNLHFRTKECLERCTKDSSAEETLIADVIRRMQSALKHDPTTLKPHDGKMIVELSELVITELNKIHGTPVGILLMERAREGRMPGYRSQECWSDLQHTMSRIRAYSQSIVYFLNAWKTWPSLFEDFEVSFIASSMPVPPLTRVKRETAEKIVGRMTNDARVMGTFKIYVKTLQKFNLNERIRSNDKKQPIVHSEVLLLDWLNKTEGGVNSQRFFNEWMYIGASKPTCRLCHYYFESYDTVVEHRPSHRNIYNTWRVPDPLPSQGKEGIRARDDMMDRVLERIRRDAFALVQQRVRSSLKRDDSNSFSDPKTFTQDEIVGDAGREDVVEIIPGLSRLSVS